MLLLSSTAEAVQCLLLLSYITVVYHPLSLWQVLAAWSISPHMLHVLGAHCSHHMFLLCTMVLCMLLLLFLMLLLVAIAVAQLSVSGTMCYTFCS
jgi:hypothetical protein